MIKKGEQLSNRSREKQQLLTSFPNENDKHIDYVIAFKDVEVGAHNGLLLTKRFEFFNELKKESFDLYPIESSSMTGHFNYMLLHCPTDRLLEEAETMRLKMRLKSVELNESCVSKKVCKAKKKGEEFWAAYDPLIKFLFEGVNTKEGPFNNGTRIMLVDHILKNLTFSPDSEKGKLKVYNNLNKMSLEESNTENFDMSTIIDEMSEIEIDYNKGLPAMLNKKYFDDAFALHDCSEVRKNHFSTNEVFNILEQYKLNNEPDEFLTLYKKWAKFRRMFNFQPLHMIRSYFGELNAFYFAWLGTFMATLVLPALVGIAFSVAGQILSLQGSNSVLSLANMNSIKTNNFTFNHFIKSFDNDLSPFFSVIICLWGAVFMETWKRQNIRLASEWNVRNYENTEPDLPHYLQKKEREEAYAKKDGSCGKFFLRYSKVFKYSVSFMVVTLMVAIVVLEIYLIILYRLHINKVLFSNNELLKLIVGDIVSSCLETTFTLILSAVFKKLANMLTNWENHRTRTMFQDALIVKLFAFEFINHYGALFYLAYLRNIQYSSGLFNLGAEYNDQCEGNNCMRILSIQMITLLTAKPLLAFIKSIIRKCLSKRCQNKHRVGILPPDITNETAVVLNVSNERLRSKSNELAASDFTDKVIFFGYLILFSGPALYIGPLLVLIVFLFDLRQDAKTMLFMQRRPICYKAQDIGSWFFICRLLNVLGIINNGFLVAFTSEWSKTFLGNSTENRYLFLLIFEHSVFAVWFLIILLIPDVSTRVQNKIRYEYLHVQEIVSAAKNLKYNVCKGDNQCAINNFESRAIIPSQDDIIDKYLVDNRIKSSRLKLPKLNLQPITDSKNATTRTETGEQFTSSDSDYTERTNK